MISKIVIFELVNLECQYVTYYFFCSVQYTEVVNPNYRSQELDNSM
jgi:hypothetical protein